MTPKPYRRRVSVSAAAAVGSLTYVLTWSAPLNPGGTITGYTVRWGVVSGVLPNSFTTTGTGTSYTITGLTVGTWFATVATVVGGIESDPSSERSFTV